MRGSFCGFLLASMGAVTVMALSTCVSAEAATRTTTAKLPDLIVTSISMSPSSPAPGAAVTFKAVVKNQGTAATPAGVIIGVAFLVDGTEVTWSDNHTNSLAVGASATLTADSGPTGSATWSATAGTHTIEAWVNDVGRFAESNTSNNTLSKSFTVGAGLPDLIVSSISMSPSNPAPGAAVTFSAVVKNQGNAATPAGVTIGVAFLVDGNEVTWSDNDSNSLAAGASVTLTADSSTSGIATWSATAGAHTIEAWVNDVGRFAESNTNNNTLTQSFTVAAAAGGLSYGANLHANADYGNGSASAIGTQLQLMAARNLNVARMDIVPSTSDNALMQTLASAAQTNGMHVILMLDLNWVVTSDAYTFLSNNQTTIYNTAYNAVYNFVLPYRSNPNIDWELGNEIDLKTSDLSTSPSDWNSGWTASEWANFSAYGSSDYYGNWAAAVKGAADAIAAINSQYGTSMRRVLNTTMTHTGFLDYMTSKGVGYEVISYHYYQYSGTDPNDLSAEPPGASSYDWNLFSALAAYNLPVTIDEINCAEIYESNFQNTTSDPLYATCLTNLRTQIGLFKNNTILKIESLVPYELLDEPSQSAPENHFGLFWNDGNGGYTPKANLYLWSAFAGGSLSSSEQSVLSSYGLLPLP